MKLRLRGPSPLGLVVAAGRGAGRVRRRRHLRAEPAAPPEVTGGAAPAAQDCNNRLQSYAPNAGDPLGIPSGSTMAAIRQRGRLIAGVSADTYLLGARNPVTGEVEGFDIDFVKQVAEAIFGDEDRYQLRVITAAQRLEVLAEPRGRHGRPQHDDHLRPLEVHRVLGRVLPGRPEDPGPQGLRHHRARLPRRPPGLRAARHLQHGQPDPARARRRAGRRRQPHRLPGAAPGGPGRRDHRRRHGARRPGRRRTPTPWCSTRRPFTEEPYGIGVPADQVDMVRFVNGVLERMRADGSWDASYAKWLQPTLGKSSGQPQPQYGRPHERRSTWWRRVSP